MTTLHFTKYTLSSLIVAHFSQHIGSSDALIDDRSVSFELRGPALQSVTKASAS